jgi:hypothetical protein
VPTGRHAHRHFAEASSASAPYSLTPPPPAPSRLDVSSRLRRHGTPQRREGGSITRGAWEGWVGDGTDMDSFIISCGYVYVRRHAFGGGGFPPGERGRANYTCNSPEHGICTFLQREWVGLSLAPGKSSLEHTHGAPFVAQTAVVSLGVHSSRCVSRPFLCAPHPDADSRHPPRIPPTHSIPAMFSIRNHRANEPVR